MFPRVPRSEFQRIKGAGAKKRMRARIDAGRVPGVIGYLDGEPAGWCSIEPRDEMVTLRRSRLFQPIDDQPVWSISCLFLLPKFRRRGLATSLIEGAVAWAKKRGGQYVEAYPVEPRNAEMPAVFAYMGIAKSFRAAGFEEVARRSPTRPMVRKRLSSL